MSIDKWLTKTQDVNPLKPSPALLCKLGSFIIHTEEMNGPDGCVHDKLARDDVRNDPEVQEWLNQMDRMAMLPVKRRK